MRPHITDPRRDAEDSTMTRAYTAIARAEKPHPNTLAAQKRPVTRADGSRVREYTRIERDAED